MKGQMNFNRSVKTAGNQNTRGAKSASGDATNGDATIDRAASNGTAIDEHARCASRRISTVRARLAAAVLSVSALATGCMVGPNYHTPDVKDVTPDANAFAETY